MKESAEYRAEVRASQYQRRQVGRMSENVAGQKLHPVVGQRECPKSGQPVERSTVDELCPVVVETEHRQAAAEQHERVGRQHAHLVVSQVQYLYDVTHAHSDVIHRLNSRRI